MDENNETKEEVTADSGLSDGLGWVLPKPSAKSGDVLVMLKGEPLWVAGDIVARAVANGQAAYDAAYTQTLRDHGLDA